MAQLIQLKELYLKHSLFILPLLMVLNAVNYIVLINCHYTSYFTTMFSEECMVTMFYTGLTIWTVKEQIIRKVKEDEETN